MDYAIELNHMQTTRVMQRVYDAGIMVHVQPKCWSGSFEALLLTGSGEVFELRADHASGGKAEQLTNMYCQIEFDLNDGHYFFDSYVVSARCAADVLFLCVARPDTILVRQRRRTERMDSEQGVIAQMTSVDSDRFSSHQGELRDLSEDGLALKLSAPEADQFQIDQKWCVCFELPEQAHVYKLSGIVRQITPSSGNRKVVIGVEFDQHENNEPELEHLREFLGAWLGAQPVMGDPR